MNIPSPVLNRAGGFNRFENVMPVLLGILLLAAPAAAQAQFTYTTNSDGATLTITGYTGPGGFVAIPDAINGLEVTGIGTSAFYNNTSVTGVAIPGSVVSVGGAAFLHCTELTSAIIAYGVTSIGTNAFYECDRLTNVIIPGSVTNIGAFAFAISGLTSVTIPGSVTTMGDSLFQDCFHLSEVYFYGNAPTGPPNQFSGDDIIFFKTGVYYFPGTTGWDELLCNPAYGCLPSQSFPVPAKFIYTTNGGAITITGYLGSGSAAVIPATTNGLPVTSIGAGAFYDQIGLNNVTIPASVTNIGANAFEFCANLTAITVDTNNPTYGSVGGVVFDKSQTTLIQYPPGLSGSYTIPDTVTNIGDFAFDGCSGLTGVTIPSTVTRIGVAAFAVLRQPDKPGDSSKRGRHRARRLL